MRRRNRLAPAYVRSRVILMQASAVDPEAVRRRLSVVESPQSKSVGQCGSRYCSKKREIWARVTRETESSGSSCSPKKRAPTVSTSVRGT
jgi:hypothetical protein